MIIVRRLALMFFTLLCAAQALLASEAALIARTQETIRLYNRLTPGAPSSSPLGDLQLAPQEFYRATYLRFSLELSRIPPHSDDQAPPPVVERVRELWQQVLAEETASGSYLVSDLLAHPEEPAFLERFSALVAAGAFSVASTQHSPFSSLENINYTLLFGFLLRQNPASHRLILGLFEAFFRAKDAAFPFLNEDAARKKATIDYRKAWWEKASVPLLQHFLGSGNWHAGRALLAHLGGEGVPLLHQLPADGQDLEPSFTCALLERILSSMDEQWSALTSSSPSSHPPGFDFPWHAALNADAGSRIFSGSYYRRLARSSRLGEQELTAEQQKHLLLYIAAGIMRNELLAQLGREISQQLQQEQGKGLYFYHLARYLTCHENKFFHLTVDNGYERLFFSSPLFSQSVLRTVLTRGNLLALQKILFLAPRALFFPQQTSIIHLLLEPLEGLVPANKAKAEGSALILLRYMLTAAFSAQFSRQLRQALAMKNHKGASPLALALRGNYQLLYAEMKNYLLMHQAYKEEDHKV